MGESSSPAQPASLADRSHSDWRPRALTSSAWPGRRIALPCSRVSGVRPVIGNLSDAALLAQEARAADAVINAADADDPHAVETLVAALAGTGKALIHTSGSSIVADEAGGEPGDLIYTDIPEHPVSGKAARVAIDRRVLAAVRRQRPFDRRLPHHDLRHGTRPDAPRASRSPRSSGTHETAGRRTTSAVV